ncbi:unnamed protein product, partial [Mesorhabditis spiculigera]
MTAHLPRIKATAEWRSGSNWNSNSSWRGGGGTDIYTNRSADSDRDPEKIMLPNVPQPKNGMIRTYENSSRTFTRPYSAKTVFFYKEGDEYFTGVRIPVSKARYRTIDSLLDDLNTNIPMAYGVRRLMTPMGRNEVQTIDELQHLGKYVATSGKSRGLNLSGVERLQKARDAAEKALRREGPNGQSYWIPASPSYRQKLRMSRTLGLNVQPCKQIFFVLNGKTQIFRLVLNPIRMPHLDTLLEQISLGLGTQPVNRMVEPVSQRPVSNPHLQLIHTKNRTNARKNTRKMTGAPKRKIQRRIPSLDPPNSATTKSDDSGKAPSVESSVRTMNGEDMPSGRSIETSASDYPGSPLSERASARSEEEKPRSAKPDTPDNAETYLSSDEDEEMEKQEKAATTIQAAFRGHKVRKEMMAREEQYHPEERARRHEAATKIQANYRGYRVRKGGRGIGEEQPAATNYEAVGAEEDEEARHAAATRIQAHYRGYRTRKQLKAGRAVDVQQYDEEEEAARHAAATRIQAQYRGYRTRKELNTMRNGKEEEELDQEHLAATKIQAQYRGYRTRKGLAAGPGEETEMDEEEERRRHQAATKIQAQYRGYRTRKQLKRSQDSYEAKEEAATLIQATYRGYRTRKRLKHVDFTGEQPTVIEAEEEMGGVEEEVEHRVHDAVETAEGVEQAGGMAYTIAVLTGNRWGADSEADLYVTLYGDDATSTQFWLKPDVSWLQSGEGKFKSNQLDSFHVTSQPLGTLNKVVIGHERRGYGAGIFIEHLLVTENVVDGRQFVFFCSKWLDSGQVDGKIERSLPVSAFYYISSIPEDGVSSQGRWEFILHNGTPDGEGGTTSNLNIVGYGTQGSSMTTISTDKSLNEVPSTSLIQVDFGEIGDLLKVRFEIDGSGEHPDYFLEYVELRDLDTEERLAVRVGKWLDVTGAHKKPQPYREISVFRAGQTPLAINNYEGKVVAGDVRMLKTEKLRGQLIGEYSDSGIFPLIKGDKNEYSFKAECVYLGRIHGIRIIGEFTEKGEAALEGFATLQEIWDRRGVPGLDMAAEFVATSAYVRESTHCPYRYVLSMGRVQDLPEEDGLYHKQLTLTEMEGLPTRYKKDKRESEQDSWTLSMSVKDDSDMIPYAELCAGPSTIPMNAQTEEFEAQEMSYQMRGKAVGTVDKVRLGVRGEMRGRRLHVRRMRLSNAMTGEEMRFPSVDTEFHDNAVYEYPTVYPDVPPKQNIVYTLQLETSSINGVIQPCAILIGRDGGSGTRILRAERLTQSEMTEDYEIEAVDLGQLEAIELSYEAETDVEWQLMARVSSTKDDIEYQTGKITIRKPGQSVTSALGEIV